MMITISVVLMALAAILTSYRILRGPSTFDRLLATDTLTVIVVAFLAILAATGIRGPVMDVAIVYAVIGFVGVVVIARFLKEVE